MALAAWLENGQEYQRHISIEKSSVFLKRVNMRDPLCPLSPMYLKCHETNDKACVRSQSATLDSHYQNSKFSAMNLSKMELQDDSFTSKL